MMVTDKAAINKAYKIGTKKLGFDFCEEVASDYEDSKLDDEKWEKIKQLGYQNEDAEEEDIRICVGP